MTNPTTIQADLANGIAFLSDLNAAYISDLKRGIRHNPLDERSSLYRAVKALKFQVEGGIYDEVTEVNYQEMMRIIGDYDVAPTPTVNAGADKSINLPATSTTFTGTVSNYTSLLWTQVSGPNTATLSNATTLTLTASGLVQGNYVFKLTAFNGTKQASDTVALSVQAVLNPIYYWSQPTGVLPTEEQIVTKSFITVTSGNDYVIPFTADGQSLYRFVAQPTVEPNKVLWEDTVNALNKGAIGSPEDLFDDAVVGTFEVYFTNYETEFANSIRFKK